MKMGRRDIVIFNDTGLCVDIATTATDHHCHHHHRCIATINAIMVIFEMYIICTQCSVHWQLAKRMHQQTSIAFCFFFVRKSHEMEMYIFTSYNSMNASFCHTRAVLIHCIVGFFVISFVQLFLFCVCV